MIVKFDYYNPILEKYQSIAGDFLEGWIADDPRFIIENYTVDGVPHKGRMIFRQKLVDGVILQKGDELYKFPEIQLVNFNEKKGVTTIKWADNTITQVRVQRDMGDVYDPEMGMAMCIAKKALGNKGNFNEVFKKWLPKED